MQAPAEDKPEVPAEATPEEKAATKEASRFAYDTLVSEPEVTAAPKRGKDGHLTLASMGVGGNSGGAQFHMQFDGVCLFTLP